MYSWNLIPFNFGNSLLKYSGQRFSKESSSLLVQVDKFFEHYSFSFKRKVPSFERGFVRELNAHRFCVASHLTRTLLLTRGDVIFVRTIYYCLLRMRSLLIDIVCLFCCTYFLIVHWSWLFVFLHIFPTDPWNMLNSFEPDLFSFKKKSF